AGAFSALAILIRPNLAPLAAVLFVWLALHDRERRHWVRSIAFAVATLPGPLVVAAINARLYGSPLSSGYGDIGQLFSLQYVPVTLSRYATWFAETQTPLAFAGMILLIAAPRSVWPAPALRANAWLLAGVAVVTWLLYSVYQPFGAWWFLR